MSLAPKKSALVISVATDIYLDYWFNMLRSYQSTYREHDRELRFIVLTDRVNDASEMAQGFEETPIQAFFVDAEPWPNASMHRYLTYLRFEHEILEHNLPVLHLDADMIFSGGIEEEIWQRLALKDALLVRHPGYYNRLSMRRLSQQGLRGLRGLLRDTAQEVMRGGIGAWELSKLSQAYIPRRDRKTYVCGGVWFASQQGFRKLITDMVKRIGHDENRGVTAAWHDESHLNAWLASNRGNVGLLSPSYCFAEGLPWLQGHKRIIETVEKGERRLR